MPADPTPSIAPLDLDGLDLDDDVVALCARLVDVPSESHHERALADLVEAALRARPHLRVRRDGNTIVADTQLGRGERVLVGGHLDTVPAAGNLPHRIEGGRLYGLGACDMKGGVAVALRCAAHVPDPVRDVTYVFYEAEEVEERHNGLKRLADTHPDWLVADLAVLMEPSDAGVEAGCQGTLRAVVRTHGRRAHSARSWLGDNAIHRSGEVLDRLRSYEPRRVDVDGLEYREGLNAVGIAGGVAGNVIPDECAVTVNYRFAPSRGPQEAEAHVREVFDGFDVEVVDLAAGAMPGLGRPAAQEFVAAVGGQPRPKFGWTDVARFAALGVPAVNYGPGDPGLAHTRDEYVPVDQLIDVETRLRAWLDGR
ncbi:MAG: succinyl-diaminopimelate desuccinylase [Candidatus Nanopelagicales bacterium]